MPPKKFVKSNKRLNDEKYSPPKKAPLAIDGIPILDYPSNTNHEIIIKLEKLLTSHVEKLYPHNGRIFKDGERYQFDEIEPPEEVLDDDNDPGGIKRRMLQKRVDKLVDNQEAEKDNRIKVFSIIWNQLTIAFQQKV